MNGFTYDFHTRIFNYHLLFNFCNDHNRPSLVLDYLNQIAWGVMQLMPQHEHRPYWFLYPMHYFVIKIIDLLVYTIDITLKIVLHARHRS